MDKAPHWRNAADPLTETTKPTFKAVSEDLARVPLGRRIVTVVFVILNGVHLVATVALMKEDRPHHTGGSALRRAARSARAGASRSMK